MPTFPIDLAYLRVALTALVQVFVVILWAEASQSFSRRWEFYNKNEHLWFLGGLWALYATLLWLVSLL